ncbi:MAG: metallophosphoesterase [Planctomycetota bacterium]
MFKTMVQRAISDRIAPQRRSPESRLGEERAEMRRSLERGLDEKSNTGAGKFLGLLDPVFRGLRHGLGKIGLYERLSDRATRFSIVERRYSFFDLPAGLEGLRILQISDPHIDSHPGFAERLASAVGKVEADLVVLTGDYRFEVAGRPDRALAGMRRVLDAVEPRLGTFAVLGNHDSLAMVEPLESLGAKVLLNEGHEIEVGGALLWVGGCDDPIYYRTHDVAAAMKGAPSIAFRLFLSHAPDVAEEAAGHEVDLFLCGHTHGGQVNLAPGFTLVSNSRCPRDRVRGEWRVGAMTGYTSSGVGFSGIPLRTFSRSEIVLHVLESLS